MFMLTPHRSPGLRLIVVLTALALVPVACQAAGPDAPPDWRPSADGQEVVDQRTGLAWSRCVEGMRWTGKTCTGAPTLATHKEALALASKRRQADGQDWRLPRVTDLRRLHQALAGSAREADRLFPAAPHDLYWAGTARVDSRATTVNQYNYGNIAERHTSEGLNRLGFLHGWAVDMRTGEAQGEVSKRSRLPVRLVRPPLAEAVEK